VKADYDQAFKILVDLNPNDWALLAGLTVVNNAAGMETELAERNRHLDRLIRVSDDRVDIAVHLEFQAGKSGNRVPIRLLDYSIGVTEKYRLPVHSCVVLLRRPADSPVLTGAYKQRSRGVMPYLTFRYRVVRLWQVPVTTLLLPGSSVAVAGVLSDYGTLTADEIAEGFIEGAQFADFYGEDFKFKIESLDKEFAYAVYCRSGKRSGNAIEIMQDAGFHNLFNLDGGIIDWASAGMPMVSN
jgi:rhodanese-related sulfurtransferase